VLDVARDVSELPTEQLEAETCTLAAQLAAATCRFLLLVGELERREAWRSWGCRSLAHWLSWQCGLSLHAAREQVRVAMSIPTGVAPSRRRARAVCSTTTTARSRSLRRSRPTLRWLSSTPWSARRRSFREESTSPRGRFERRVLRAHWRHVPFTQRRVLGTAIYTAHGEKLDLDLTITALCCLVPPDRN
jgi:hypothetical protein